MMEDLKKIGHKDLKPQSVDNKYIWHLTGIKHIDIEMANLDRRISLFQDRASKAQLKKYDQQEDRNMHFENAEMVNKFANQQKPSSILPKNNTFPISPKDGIPLTEDDVMADDDEIRRLKAEIKRFEEREKYQSWSNRETWAAGLWIDNEESMYNDVLAIVKEIKSGIGEDTNVKKGIWTEQEALKFRLSDRLERWFRDDLREMRPESPTLVTVFDEIGSLWRVDWGELANHYIEAESEG